MKSISSIQGGFPPGLGAVITEAQGLTFALIAGGSANAKLNIAAIRKEDTVLFAMNNNAETLTDVTNTITISETRASATLTVASVVNTDVCVVNGVTYTFKTTPTLENHIKVTAAGAGADNANAAALARAINRYEGRFVSGELNTPKVKAVANAAVVTVTSNADGAAGNAITFTGTAVRLVATGGGHLAGGTDTGSISSSGATNQLLVAWYNLK